MQLVECIVSRSLEIRTRDEWISLVISKPYINFKNNRLTSIDDGCQPVKNLLSSSRIADFEANRLESKEEARSFLVYQVSTSHEAIELSSNEIVIRLAHAVIRCFFGDSHIMNM